VKKKLLRVSEWDEKSDTYTMSAYLIAQLGKNFINGVDKKITGEELLVLAWNKIKEIQYLGGGVVTFLEAENKEKLLSFYRDNRFSLFDTRQNASDTDESHELVQLLRLL
ncbi:MAG: GNAT family acetyltransferase, partial [Lachnospiraceae bacterium]|nr:GNAT family acetyltransferase [Lachnospiraceae bacterium]